MTSDKMTQSPRLTHVVIPLENRVKMGDLKFGPDARGKAMYSMEYPKRPHWRTAGMPSSLDTTGFGELFEW